ncbi:hypothetical protein ACFWNG_04910 [Streptomyces sp. NPDC058391]|uniref:hypothetical protein n=1 Tax=Streptomyces sp. NPDC058391 TaxID=3346476 RepID=UPI003665B8C2
MADEEGGYADEGEEALRLSIGGRPRGMDGKRPVGEAGGAPEEGYQRTDLNGERAMHCIDETTDATFLDPFDDRIKIDCDMGRGASAFSLRGRS